VAFLTVRCREVSLDILGSAGPDVEATGTVACLTSRVSEIRRFVLRAKATGHSVSGSVTFETLAELSCRQPSLHFFNAVKGVGLFRELPVAGVLGFVTIPACLVTHISWPRPCLSLRELGTSEQQEPEDYKSGAGLSQLRHEPTAPPPRQPTDPECGFGRAESISTNPITTRQPLTTIDPTDASFFQARAHLMLFSLPY